MKSPLIAYPKRTALLHVLIISADKLLAITGISLLFRSMIPFSKKNAEKIFEQDKEELGKIAKYLLESEYASLSVNDAYSFYALGEDYAIIDSEISKAIKTLHAKRKYLSIERSGNTVEFVRHSKIGGETAGFVYSTSEDAIDIPFLISIEPLSDKGWYFYKKNEKKSQLTGRQKQ